MTTIAQEKRGLPFSFYVLGPLTLIGVALGVYRLAAGLGPTTNLSDHYPWGLWITMDMFLIPVAGSAFTVSLISLFFGREKCHTIIRPAVLIGLLGYLAVGALLIMDIGRWTQFYNVMIPGYWNLHSFLEEIALCVTLYTVILMLEAAPILLEKWNLQALVRFIERLTIPIAGAGILLSCLHQSSIGSMFLILEHKLHPLWWTPILPLLYFTQALFSGLGMAGIAANLTWKKLGIELDREMFFKMGKIIRATLIVYLMFKVGDWLLAGELGLLFSSGAYSLLIWAELVIGVILPIAILFTKFGARPDGVLWANVWILMGLFINRLTVAWIGLKAPAGVPYVPHWMEIMITVGIVAGIILAYNVAARYFTLFFDEKHE